VKTSDQINEIAAALAKAQATIKDAAKSIQAYNYKYADLASVLQIVRPALSSNGIAVLQDTETLPNASISVTTRLLHVSGQWVESSPLALVIEAKKGLSAAQNAGSVVTYARRYSLAALVGLAQEDDDASAGKEAPPVEVISEAQLSTLRDLLAAAGKAEADVAKAMGVASLDLLPAARYPAVVKRLEALAKEAA
jgi:hypothetical protein